jgi:hypothetical protein
MKRKMALNRLFNLAGAFTNAVVYANGTPKVSDAAANLVMEAVRLHLSMLARSGILSSKVERILEKDAKNG